MFSGDSRQAFRHAVGQDEGTWARARGWALWKALLILAECIDTDKDRAAINQRVIGEVCPTTTASASGSWAER
jgi:hypothetical protein